MHVDGLWNRLHGQEGRRLGQNKYRKCFQQVGCEGKLKELQLKADLWSKENSF